MEVLTDRIKLQVRDKIRLPAQSLLSQTRSLFQTFYKGGNVPIDKYLEDEEGNKEQIKLAFYLVVIEKSAAQLHLYAYVDDNNFRYAASNYNTVAVPPSEQHFPPDKVFIAKIVLTTDHEKNQIQITDFIHNIRLYGLPQKKDYSSMTSTTDFTKDVARYTRDLRTTKDLSAVMLCVAFVYLYDVLFQKQNQNIYNYTVVYKLTPSRINLHNYEISIDSLRGYYEEKEISAEKKIESIIESVERFGRGNLGADILNLKNLLLQVERTNSKSTKQKLLDEAFAYYRDFTAFESAMGYFYNLGFYILSTPEHRIERITECNVQIFFSRFVDNCSKFDS